MKTFTTKAHIYSLNGEMREVVIIQQDNEYCAVYNNKVCTAIYNGFTCQFYVDDKYGIKGE